jgi:uncharacterized protein
MSQSDLIHVGITRNDGVIENLAVGMGDPGADTSMHYGVVRARMLTKYALESLYQGSWICQNIIDKYPQESTRKWLEIKLGGKAKDKTKIDDFNTYQKLLGLKQAVATADRWARLYGGAAIIIIAEDGQPCDQPMRLEHIRTIRKLKVLDRWHIRPCLEHMTYEDPEYYEIILSPRILKDFQKILGQKGMTMKIHKSRIARFDGVPMPPDILVQNEGWGLPILNLVYDTFARFEGMDTGVNNLVNDASVFTYKMKNLAELLAKADEKSVEILHKRLRSLRSSKSLYKALILDADKEDASFVSRTFTGLPDLMDKMMLRLVGAADMPMSILFGQGPQGLAAQGTGDAEEKVWSKAVQQHQVDRYEPILRSPHMDGLFDLIWLAQDGPTKGKMPDDWSMQWRSLIEQSDEEVQNQKEKQSNIDKTYVDMKVLLPEEIRTSRFKGAEYSTETVLDEELWKKKEEEDPFAAFDDFGGDGGEQPEDPNAPTEAPPEEEPQEQEPPDRQDSADRPKSILNWRGLSLGVTHRPGDMRHGKPMACFYAHIRGSYGDAEDGMAHDCYLQPGAAQAGKGGDRLFKVRQLKQDGTIDESKWMLGCPSAAAARDLYLRHMPESLFGGVEEVPWTALARYVKPQPANQPQPRGRQFEDIESVVDREDGGAYATSNRDAADWITDNTLTAAADGIGVWFEQIGDWLEQQRQDGRSLQDVDVTELYSQLDGDIFASHLSHARMVADLAGQAEVQDEVADDETNAI